MTPDDVKKIREALGEVVGRRISQHDLGLALGLAPASAGRSVREWETSGPTGPAAAALGFMLLCTGIVPKIARETQNDIAEIVKLMFDANARAESRNAT
jgi:hypothetical protein